MLNRLGPLGPRATPVALLCLILACGSSRIARAQQTPAKVLLVSDIHFEPFWDPGKKADLASKPASAWAAILAAPASRNRAAAFGALEEKCRGRGQDTSFPLFQSSLDEMKRDAAAAAFVTVSGDLVSHRIQCEYGKLFPGAKPQDYRTFVEKTIEFVIAELNGIAPGAPVFVALGNNDSDCRDWSLDGNSRLGSDNTFLADLAGEITSAVPAPDRQQALKTFSTGAFYSTPLPAPMKDARLLVLDDLFLGNGYSPCSAGGDASAAELKWLAQQLDDARTAKQRVWVMGHIPTGVDPYSTLHGAGFQCGSSPALFLSSDSLTGLLGDAADVVALGIFAHTHMDEIKLVVDAANSGPLKAVPVKVVPSISPVNGNNPAFTVATVDPANATMTDYSVFAASNSDVVTPSGKSGATWAEEYKYSDYGQPAFSADNVAALVAKLAADSSGTGQLSKDYINHYESGKTSSFPASAWPQYVCTMTHNTAAGFNTCACPSH